MAALLISERLPPFLVRAATEPIAWGEWDCCMLLANWLRDLTGRDPAAELRGRYRTELGWQRIVRREGGLVALVGRLATVAGLAPTDAPRPGDIGIVETPQFGPAGAIKLERGWAMKLSRGLVRADWPMLAAWAL